MKLRIGYFYPNELNLYGDTGNIEILKYRAEKRGIETEIYQIGVSEQVSSDFMSKIDLVFMGGGPDSSQKNMYEDLVFKKRQFLEEYIENGGVGLFICGSYQLLGQYYKSADGAILDGLGLVDFYTENFGLEKARCIGNVVCEVAQELRHCDEFNLNNSIGPSLVGFENHGGRTYLGKNILPFARIIKGYGNNGEDKTEGILYKNIIGSYLHGPILSKNSHLADYLISKSLKLKDLLKLDDSLIINAHTALKNIKQ